MKAFEYAAPRSEAEAVSLLSAEPGKTEVLAGGTDLVGLMKKMIVTPDRVVNIMEVPSMRAINPQADGGLVIGAAATLDTLLESNYLGDFPAVTQAIRGINSMQLQAQGTLGGELCQRPRCWFFRDGHGLLNEASRMTDEGDNRFHAIFDNDGPAKYVSSSRIAPALVALGAEVRVLGPAEDEEKLVGVEEFFHTPQHDGQRETALLPNQLLTHIVLPPARGVANATYEVRHGEGPDYPLAAAAAALVIEGGRVREARIVLGQVAPTPWVSTEAAHAIVGRAVNEETATAAGEAAVDAARPLSNNHYKVQLAKVAVKRAILLAAGLETGGF